MLNLFNPYIYSLISNCDFIDILLFILIIYIIWSILYFTIYFTNLNKQLIPTTSHNICEKLYRMYDNEHYDILTNLLLKDNCDKIINEADDYGNKNGWTTTRHSEYPTYDNQITTDWKCYVYIENICKQKIYSKIAEMYNIDSNDIGINELFIAKYDMKHKQELDAHRDGSEFSFIIALNDNFTGGGTYFVDTKKHISLEKGDCLVFSGQNKHKGVKIKSGTRYIIAGFLHFKNCDFCANKLYNSNTYCKGKK